MSKPAIGRSYTSILSTGVQVFGIVLSLWAHKVSAETSKDKFCREHSSLKNIETRMRDYRNMVGVGNDSGFLGMNTGVCWWHSRFQRNSSYLVQMAPDQPAPTKKQAKELIKKIVSGKEVVVIPGHTDFRMFTHTYRKEVIGALRGWINRDFIIKQDWTKIFKGDAILSVGDFQNHMGNLHQEFIENDGIMLIILNIDGPIKHSWLVTNFQKNENGWDLSIVDSESALYVFDIFISKDASSMLPSYKFEKNKEFLRSSAARIANYTGVGYVHQQPELKRLKKVLSDYCSK